MKNQEKWKNSMRICVGMLLALVFVSGLLLFVSADTGSGSLTDEISINGLEVSYTSTKENDNCQAEWSVSEGDITGKAVGYSSVSLSGSTFAQAETVLTLKNTKEEDVILSFTYAITFSGEDAYSPSNKWHATISYGNGTLVDTGDNKNGSVEGIRLCNGEAVTITLRSSNRNGGTAQIQITDLQLLSTAVQYTIQFSPVEHGSYTVEGATGDTIEVGPDTGVAVDASAADGYRFFGWYSETESTYLSYDAATKLFFKSSQTVYPVFLQDTVPIFETGGARFTDLNKANDYAFAKGYTQINLVADGTLPSGNYTISSGVTLLIPFDSAYTCYTATPEYAENVWEKPSAYRTLTLEEGASVTVQGAISVSAKHSSKMGYNGCPTGDYGYIKMQKGSSITVESGASLYAWGYISGSGQITAKSGASVYEYFQIRDWRGGDAVLSIISDNGLLGGKHRVFPFSQYYVQNIEVPLTLEAGATETVYTSISASVSSVVYTASTPISFVGTSDSMFVLSEGCAFTKSYNPTTDQIKFHVRGDMALNGISINVRLSVINETIYSADYVLPITNNVSLEIESGTTTVNQDICLQPGVQVTIDNGAELKVASGYSMYVYDKDQWGNYCFSSAPLRPIAYTPTKTKTRSDADLVDVVIDVNGTLTADGYLYTTAGGADINSSEGTGKVVMTNGAGTAATTYQATQNNKEITYVGIPITSAKLHNGSQYVGTEEEYTLTDGVAAGTTYYYDVNRSLWYKADFEVICSTLNYRLDSYIWLNGTVKITDLSGVSLNVSGEKFTAVSDSKVAVVNDTDFQYYLVRKVLSDELPDNMTFVLTYTDDNGSHFSNPITVSFETYAEELKSKEGTAEKTKNLLSAMITYGKAAKNYFADGAYSLESELPTLTPEEMSQYQSLVSPYGYQDYKDDYIVTNGVNFSFDERITLQYEFQFYQGNVGGEDIVQVGLLVGTPETKLTTANYTTAYLLYQGDAYSSSNDNSYDGSTTTVYGNTDIGNLNFNAPLDVCFDLKSVEYAAQFELRAFVVVQTGTDEEGNALYAAVYGSQYTYGLKNYIARMSQSDDTKLNNFLLATWAYANAAQEAF